MKKPAVAAALAVPPVPTFRPVYLDVRRVAFLLKLHKCRAYAKACAMFDYLGGELVAKCPAPVPLVPSACDEREARNGAAALKQP